jgi:PQQ enzyme repeat
VSDIGFKLKQNPTGSMNVELNPRQGGGIFAYDLATGEERWATRRPAVTDGRIAAQHNLLLSVPFLAPCFRDPLMAICAPIQHRREKCCGISIRRVSLRPSMR